MVLKIVSCTMYNINKLGITLTCVKGTLHHGGKTAEDSKQGLLHTLIRQIRLLLYITNHEHYS